MAIKKLKKKISKSKATFKRQYKRKRNPGSTAANDAAIAAAAGIGSGAVGAGAIGFGVSKIRNRGSKTLAGRAGAAAGTAARKGRKLSEKHKKAISRALKGRRR
jgi:hypothetical protein